MLAICFDFYNTLCYFAPPREERQARAAREHGLVLSPDLLRAAYVTAEHLWTIENARWPIGRRPADERTAFYTVYEQTLLAAAGVKVPRDVALRVYRSYAELPRQLILFDDALPALQAAHERGAAVAIISNTDENLGRLCGELGLATHLDALVCSCDVGREKPAPEVFRAALERLGVAAPRALHVGDQYHSDVIGARSVGMHAVLLDRWGLLAGFTDCQRVANLHAAVRLDVGAPATPDHA